MKKLVNWKTLLIVGSTLAGLIAMYPPSKKLKLGMSAIRSLTLALPHLQVLDTNTCTDLWRLQLSCPALKEANFQACRSVAPDPYPTLNSYRNSHPSCTLSTIWVQGNAGSCCSAIHTLAVWSQSSSERSTDAAHCSRFTIIIHNYVRGRFQWKSGGLIKKGKGDSKPHFAVHNESDFVLAAVL